jgi:Spy/CpxP family protein refolding chaperone
MPVRKLWFAGAATAALMIVGAAAFAQAPQGARPGGQNRRAGRQVSLATVPVDALKKLLNLTDEQATKIKGIQDTYQADIRALRPAPGTQPDPTTRQKRAELTRKASEDIQNVLTTEQKEKMKNLVKEIGPLMAAGIPVGVIPNLKLTDDQKKQIAAIVKETQDKRQALTPEERRSQGRQLMQDARAKIQALLTDAQKATIQKWEKDHPRRGGRRQRNP